MTDHEHEWMAYRHTDADRFLTDTIMFFKCRECHKRLPVSDVEAMLNEHAKLKRVNEKLKTYAMLMEGRVGNSGWVIDTRTGLGLNDIMMHWLVPDEHRDALADTQEKEVADE